MPESPSTVRIFHRESPVSVLGPGRRAVIWTQGCPFRCPGCTSPEGLDAGGGRAVPVDDLAGWILAQPDIEGVTFSGGDPMAQAGPLCRLIDAVCAEADLGIVCYTGYTLEHLMAHGTDEQQGLLERLDLLIDGPYVQRLHADLLWRGSSNQRLILLSGRYRADAPASEAADRGCGLEAFVAPEGTVWIAGVPARPGFRDRLQAAVNAGGE